MKTVIEMAREAGFETMLRKGRICGFDRDGDYTEEIEAFAELVRADALAEHKPYRPLQDNGSKYFGAWDKAEQALDKMAENARELGLDYEPAQETAPLRDAMVVNLVREGINKHKARELADHFIGLTNAQQEPVALFKWLPEGATHIGRISVRTTAGGSLAMTTHAFKYEEAVLKVYITDNDNEYPGWRDAKDCFFHLNFPVLPLYTSPQQPTVPDALTPADKESPEYTDGWNDCRQAMLAS